VSRALGTCFLYSFSILFFLVYSTDYYGNKNDSWDQGDKCRDQRNKDSTTNLVCLFKCTKVNVPAASPRTTTCSEIFELSGIPPVPPPPHGLPQDDIDANGISNVSASDKPVGKLN
jgi:hypothetical protein